MPNDFQLKTMNKVHRLLLTLSFGKIGWGAMGMPVIELTTTGRKSGEPRSTMLTSPLQLGDSVVIVASRGGDDRHPAWFLNLQADPAVKVRVAGGPQQPMTARITSGQERQKLWDELTAAHDLYAGYQVKTSREIPVVVLDPKI